MNDDIILLVMVLAGIIFATEFLRRDKNTELDFLMGVSSLYFVCYCVIPIFLHTLIDRDLGFWNWIFRLPFHRREYVWASLISIAGYLSIVFGFYIAKYSSAKAALDRRAGTFTVPETLQVSIAMLLGIVGIGSLIAYANEVGGFAIVIQAAGYFRNQSDPYSDLGFLIKVAPLSSLSSYLFWGLFASSKPGWKKEMYRCAFLLFFGSSLIILYSLGGRVQFFFYLLSFLLYASFRHGRIPVLSLSIAAVFFVFLILFGHEIISQNVYVDDDLIGSAWEEVSMDPLAGMRKLLLEFSFPFVSLANVLEMVPGDLGYRWFEDVPLGLAYLLPKPLLGLTLPPTVTMVYDDLIDAPIPIDLLSFGYMSMGIIGTIAVCLFFGMGVCLVDSYFSAQGNQTLLILRAAWLLFLSEQVMYGSPHHALVAGFPLIVGTLLLILCGKYAKFAQTSGRNIPAPTQTLPT